MTAKYRRLLRQQAAAQLDEWRRRSDGVPAQDVYRFLHSMKGTAGTIGLPAWSDAAHALLEPLEEDSEEMWTVERTMRYVEPIAALVSGEDLSTDAASSNEPSDGRQAGAAVGGGRDAGESRKPESGSGDVAEAGAGRGDESGVDEGVVVLLDDDTELLRVVKDALEARGVAVLATPKSQRALEWVYAMRPDCVVSDIVMPERSGLEFLASIRAYCEQEMIPTVLFSAKDDKATRLACYESGADAFVAKPLDLDVFAAVVRSRIRRRRKLARMLLVDELTGLFNANYFDREIERIREDCKRRNAPLSVAVIDVDRFRRVNEERGYAAGDRLLKRLASRLGERLGERLGDDRLLARDRFDRFLVAFAGADESESRRELERLLEDAAALELPAAEGTARTTCSAGVAAWGADSTLNECLDRAAQALQAAKAEGGGRAVAFEFAARARGGRMRIGIVDDDPLIRGLLEKRLADVVPDEDADVRSFRDGEHFFEDEWYREPGPCVLVVDRLMPRMNGIELVARLRAEFAASRFTILMLTGVGEEHSVAEALRAGVDDYITKPFSVTELEARIRKWVRGIRK